MARKIDSKMQGTQAAAPVGALEQTRAAEMATANFLMQAHGPVLDGPALMQVLHYPTLTALERSLQRGHLKVKLLDLPGRRGIYVHAFELARYLTTQMAESDNGHGEFQPDGQESNHPVEKGAQVGQKI
jgi:hypothetical protein